MEAIQETVLPAWMKRSADAKRAALQEQTEQDETDRESLVDECLKVLRGLASGYPSQRAVIAEGAPDMAESWADRMDEEGVPWSMVQLLCSDARTTLRRSGKTSFPPNIEDLLLEWDKYQTREYAQSRGVQWQEHDEQLKSRTYSDTLPVYQPDFKARGAAIVCWCRFSQDNCDAPAQLDEDGRNWLCRHHGREGDCGFSLPVESTLTAALPTKSYHGENRRVVTESFDELFDPPAKKPAPREVLTDEELLIALMDRCRLSDMNSSGGHWIAFGRWFEQQVPVDVWTPLLASALYRKFKTLDVAAVAH